ncbi:hypothetical protein GCM10023149_05420 [Mucilaginibacter gynuensis]|uniref:Signal transduction histidine kinase internal region domain-containing protein n=1 Tax=Mucilaginibacter gynuensis TaxID=1302236 RepID=A0ABP8FTL2_9SPHI
MKHKLHGALLLFLIVCFQGVYGEQYSIPEQSYLNIEPAFADKNQVIKKVKGKLVQMYTTGGWVHISITDAFKVSSKMLYYRAGLKISNENNNSAQQTTSAFQIDDRPLFIPVNSKILIDVIDLKTDTLVSRYIIKRPKLMPGIRFYRKEKSNAPFYVLPPTGRPEKLSMMPGKLDIGFAENAAFKGLEVEYVLIDEKTRRRQRGTSETGFGSLNLKANTVYELRFNYVTQNESVRSMYLFVKPYWYQSPKTYIALVVLLVTVGFVLMALLFKNKLKSSEKKQKKMEASAIRLQSLLNPHFTFNALSSIQGLINTDRIEEANQYLEEFSSLLRKTLAKSQHVFNSLDQELEMMRMYIRLEALRFNFSWNIEVAESLDLSAIEIPTLLLQPLIENAVKHGLQGLGDKAKLMITCKEGDEKDTFVITVKDNGTWVEGNGSGYGLSLTAERIRMINKLKKDQSITLEFNKLLGTEAIVTFHNWL